MAKVPDNPTDRQLREIDQKVERARAAYIDAAAERAAYFRNAGQHRSQAEIARIIGTTRQRVQQILDRGPGSPKG